MAKHVDHPIYVGSYSFVLAIVYMLITLLVSVQIARILYHKHNLKSFQFGFLLFCWVWTTLRSVIWLLTPLAEFAELVVHSVSINIQFSTFTFLVLFYVHIANKATWESTGLKNRSVGWYFVINIFFAVVLIVQVVLAATLFPASSDVMEIASTTIAAVMFLVISLLLGLYTYRLLQVIETIQVAAPFFRNNKKRVAILTVVITLIFLSRAVRDIIAAFGVGKLYFNTPTKETVGEQVLLFSLYFVWEIVPTAFVLVLFWQSKSQDSQYSVIARKYGTVEPTAVPAAQGSINGEKTVEIESDQSQSRIFSNPQRYDTDDEYADLIPKPTPSTNIKKTLGKVRKISGSPAVGSVGSFTPYNTSSPFNKPID